MVPFCCVEEFALEGVDAFDVGESPVTANISIVQHK